MKEGFERAFDDMINTAYKTKLLTSHSLTHIAIGLQQYGTKGEIFKIATLSSNDTDIESIILSFCKHNYTSWFKLPTYADN